MFVSEGREKGVERVGDAEGAGGLRERELYPAAYRSDIVCESYIDLSHL